MPCRVREEVWLEPPAGARIRERKKRKIKNKGGGVIVLQEHNTGEYLIKRFLIINHKISILTGANVLSGRCPTLMKPNK